LFAVSFALVGCPPAISQSRDGAADASVVADGDGQPACTPRGIGCLQIRVVDTATGQDVPDALVVVAAEIARDVGVYAGGSYAVVSGCTGAFVVTVEHARYQRFVGTFRSFRDRDFGCNQEFQSIEVRLQPL
jgi:hypothetical protein